MCLGCWYTFRFDFRYAFIPSGVTICIRMVVEMRFSQPNFLTPDEETELVGYIRAWMNSPFRTFQYTSQEYYDGIQEILKKRRTFLDSDRILRDYPACVPNTRMVFNLYRKIVAQKVGFISERRLRFYPTIGGEIDYSEPSSLAENTDGDIDPVDGYEMEEKEDVPILAHDNTQVEDLCEDFTRLLEKLFDNKWYAKFHDAMTDCLIDGDCWLYPFIDHNGDFAYRFFRGRDICPIYETEGRDEISAIVRVYEVRNPSGQNQTKKYVEIYRKENMVRYELEEKGNPAGTHIAARLVNGAISDYVTIVQPVPASDGVEPPKYGYRWSQIPFIHITPSDHPQPLLSRCKTILDAINQIYSNWADNVLTYPDGGILVVQNYGGEEAGSMWSEIVQNRMISVSSTPEMPGGDAHYLEPPTKSTDYEAILQSLRKALFDVCCAFDDTNESVFTSNLHELTIRTAMLSMEQDANTLVASIERALKSFVYNFYCPYLQAKGFDDYSDTSMDIKIDDIRIRNIAEITNLMVSLGMKLSNRTMLEHHPWVENVDEELDRIMQEENMQQMRMMTTQEKEAENAAENAAKNAPFGVNSKSGTVNTGSPDGGGKPNDFSKAFEHRNDETSKSEKKTTPER